MPPVGARCAGATRGGRGGATEEGCGGATGDGRGGATVSSRKTSSRHSTIWAISARQKGSCVALASNSSMASRVGSTRWASSHVIVNTAKTAEESIGAGRGPRGQLSREGTPTTSREREESSGVGGDASRLPHRAGGTAMPAAAAADAASADRPTRERGSIARAKTEASSVDPWIYVYPWSRCPRAYDHWAAARKSGQNLHANCMGKASRGAA
jgi:hypothetical protein